MATESGIFISWGTIVRRREQQATGVYRAALGYFQGLKSSGKAQDFKSHFVITGNSADMSGFFLLEGSSQQIGAVQASPEFAVLVQKGQLVVENFTLNVTITADDPIQLADMSNEIESQARQEIGI